VPFVAKFFRELNSYLEIMFNQIDEDTLEVPVQMVRGTSTGVKGYILTPRALF
jgi:hypothetical protein